MQCACKLGECERENEALKSEGKEILIHYLKLWISTLHAQSYKFIYLWHIFFFASFFIHRERNGTAKNRQTTHRLIRRWLLFMYFLAQFRRRTMRKVGRWMVVNNCVFIVDDQYMQLCKQSPAHQYRVVFLIIISFIQKILSFKKTKTGYRHYSCFISFHSGILFTDFLKFLFCSTSDKFRILNPLLCHRVLWIIKEKLYHTHTHTSSDQAF